MILFKNMGDNLKNVNAYEMERFYNQIELPVYSSGEIISGVVVDVSKNFVAVNIGSKTEGYIDIKEFQNSEGKIDVKVGGRVDVLVIGKDEDEGYIKLSKAAADRKKAIKKIEECFQNRTPVDGRIVSKTKGGFIVELGARAFLPASQVDIRWHNDFDYYIGKVSKFYITEYNPKKENIVVSRKAYLEEERGKLKTETLKIIDKDKIFNGVVKNITDYGAFVDIGGLEGLLHISDMTWGKIKHPTDLLRTGDKIKVVVLDFNRDKEKISLGIKQLTPNPWNSVREKYQAGTKIKGTVTGVTDFGAFVEVEPGIEGLVKVSEMFWGKKVGNPSAVVKLGDQVEVLILEVNPEKQRMSLGLKQFLHNPLEELEIKYPRGTKINGKITGITEFGLFVEIENGYEGLVHVSDISWFKNTSDLNKMFKIGDMIDVSVLKIDHDKEKISLGIKQLSQDPWKQAKKLYKTGNEIQAKVESVIDAGVIVDLEIGLKGFIPNKELNTGDKDSRDVFSPGLQIEAKVIEFDIKNENIVLSIRALDRDREKKEFKKYMNTTEGATMKLGDILLYSLPEGKKTD